MAAPDKNQKFPLKNYERLCFLKNIITRPNIIVGDYTYYDDFKDVNNFEKNGPTILLSKRMPPAFSAIFIKPINKAQG